MYFHDTRIQDLFQLSFKTVFEIHPHNAQFNIEMSIFLYFWNKNKFTESWYAREIINTG